MKQYLELLKTIKEKGTYKEPARENMPGTTSLFGYQFRHNLQEGFPLLTTKEVNFKHIVVELLWFLRGDSNIKFLIENDCNIWNQDAYNYYKKKLEGQKLYPVTFKDFVTAIKTNTRLESMESVHSGIPKDYQLGDTGKQYPWLWRKWGELIYQYNDKIEVGQDVIDQIKELLEGLKKNPMSRRHIITAWNPETLDDMALNACHALVQFNCRPLTYENTTSKYWDRLDGGEELYYLDCQMYQRSADVFLGVPYNIASYALLTHIICEMIGMIPGDFIHSFGDVHIYDNHMEQVNKQLVRQERELPKLICLQRNEDGFLPDNLDKYLTGRYELDDFIKSLSVDNFRLINYNPHDPIRGELSTGMKKDE